MDEICPLDYYLMSYTPHNTPPNDTGNPGMNMICSYEYDVRHINLFVIIKDLIQHHL